MGSAIAERTRALPDGRATAALPAYDRGPKDASLNSSSMAGRSDWRSTPGGSPADGALPPRTVRAVDCLVSSRLPKEQRQLAEKITDLVKPEPATMLQLAKVVASYEESRRPEPEAAAPEGLRLAK